MFRKHYKTKKNVSKLMTNSLCSFIRYDVYQWQYKYNRCYNKSLHYTDRRINPE